MIATVPVAMTMTSVTSVMTMATYHLPLTTYHSIALTTYLHCTALYYTILYLILGLVDNLFREFLLSIVPKAKRKALW